MYPQLLQIPIPFFGSVPIHSYGVMLAIGFALAIWLSWRRAPAFGMPQPAVMDIGIYAVVFGVIGARLAFILFEMPAGHPVVDYFKVWRGGLVFQGGLLLALLAGYVYIRRQKLNAAKVLDVFAPGLALGVAFGRVGCFLNGCCFGSICAADHPFGVQFPADSFVARHQNDHIMSIGPLAKKLGYTGADFPFDVHPAQLYAVAGLLGLFLVLLAIERFVPRWFDGMLMMAFLGLYSVLRFFLEFYRDDTALYFSGDGFRGFHQGQLMAAGTIPVVVILSLILYRWQKGQRERKEGSA